MIVKKGFRFRIYPTFKQRELIEKTFAACVTAHNHALELCKKCSEKHEVISLTKTSAELTIMKRTPEYAYLKDVDSVALQQTLRDLQRKYNIFFSGQGPYPREKVEKYYASYRTENQYNKIRIEGARIRLPKIGMVKIRITQPVISIINVTVERSRTGKYYVAIYGTSDMEYKDNIGGEIGIDMGIMKLVSIDDGTSIANKRFYRNAEKKIIREHRRLSRKQKGSANYDKQRNKLALAYEHTANQRSDYLKKTTTALLKMNRFIAVESLNVRLMLQNRSRAKGLSDAGMSEFLRILKSKAPHYGTTVVPVSPYYPSSQLCSNCGYKNPTLKDDGVRKWICPICGIEHDRDVNAAKNILFEAKRIISEKH